MPRPIGIDLFAGVGGMSLGFEQAGFDVRAAIEYDPIHAAAHLFNFPDCAVITRSVAGLTGAQIREAAGIGGAQVDVVFGGPPCQGFSLIGQRVIDDPRNALVKEFVRIVRELRANYFVFENVKGLTLGDASQLLKELITDFRQIGYTIRDPWKVLNASSFGVPQDRERLILLGARDGFAVPNYPFPTTYAAGSIPIPGLLQGPSCEDALGDLPDAEDFTSLLDSDSVKTTRWGTPSKYAAEMRCISAHAWHLGYRRKWDPHVVTSSLRTNHSQISRARFSETQGGRNVPIARLFKLPSNGVSNTLRAGSDSKRGAFTSPRPIHYRNARCVTVREMARLHGFPDWFRLTKAIWHGGRQIGNAVPPPLARAIAQQVIVAGRYVVSAPARVVPLGRESLLEMDMTKAAAHFGVPDPIGKRDKKSGAKKRKQSEI